MWALEALTAQWAVLADSALSDSIRCFRHNAAKPENPAQGRF